MKGLTRSGSRRIVGVRAIAAGWLLLACGGVVERGSAGERRDGEGATTGDSAADGDDAANGSSVGPAGYGAVQVALPPVPGVNFGPVTYAVTDAQGEALLNGVVSTADADGVSFSLALPPGEGYSLVLSTVSAESNDDVKCDAKLAPFDVRAGKTSNVVVVLTCRDDSSGRPLPATEIDNTCSAMFDLNAAATPAQAYVGESIFVGARAVAPEGASLSYLWSLEQPEMGYFADARAADTTFHCASFAQDLRLNVTLFVGTCALGASTTVSCLGSPKP